MFNDSTNKSQKQKITEQDFNHLTSDERIRHIVTQANYYGYSGDRVKGLIFCSRIDEAEKLSEKFNKTINPETGRYYRTIALSSNNSNDNEREHYFECLAMAEENATEEKQPLDYIFSVDILNEGVDIVEVNQVIMLRPTQSPIVFIQQLGRGLRKAEGKEYVVILDFIGNYKNNFMIPIALSGDRSYNPDNIRKYVISGNNMIPGASTIHFDEVSKERLFQSIDKIRGIRSIIKESYISLKNRLGRIPTLLDFYENGEIDPLVIIKEYKTYPDFLYQAEKVDYNISKNEQLTLEYLSKTILSGSRPYELEILKKLIYKNDFKMHSIQEELQTKYGYIITLDDLENAADVLEGHFVVNDNEYKKYSRISPIEYETNSHMVQRMSEFSNHLKNPFFLQQVNDIIEIGLRKYQEKLEAGQRPEKPFVLYEKYSRRDVSLLMNCGKDMSSTMYGMKRIKDDVFIFVTYHKVESEDVAKNYVEGKPDYADSFTDNIIFNWDSQIGRGIHSSYIKDVSTAARKHLFIKKSDAETNFYYMGLFDILDMRADKKLDNRGKERDITKLTLKMQHAVREDLFRYLQSNIQIKEEKIS